MKVLHTAEGYSVKLLDEPIVPEDLSSGIPPMNYAVTNTETDRVEVYASFLPTAIDTCDRLSEALLSHRKIDTPPRGDGDNILTLQ